MAVNVLKSLARVRIKVIGGPFSSLRGRYSNDSGYEFIYDADCTDYDWLVVFDEMPIAYESLSCTREHTILCTWEPVSIKRYSHAYTRQFGHLLTNRPPEAELHPHYHLGRGYFPWFVHGFPTVVGSIEKTEELSVVCSAKKMRHTEHHSRYRLVEALSAALPNIAWFGKGVRPLEHKIDALLPYKYHVVVENHIGRHHWTEKLSDAFLCECLPFYAGDPAIADALPPNSFIPIPLNDPECAVRIIRRSISDGEYEKRRAAVLQAKRLILSKYNFWAQVIEVIESVGSASVSYQGDERGKIYSRRKLRWHSLAALQEDAWYHLRKAMKF